MNQLIDAILFAATGHSGQFRKDGITPYINHPIEVMHLLTFTGNISNEEILISAVLHDLIEDTSINKEEIAARFGTKVAGIVQELSDDKTQTKEERKQQQFLSATDLSQEARLIRISDKICNVYDVIYAPPSGWDIARRRDYLDWANSVVKKIQGTNEKLESHFEKLIEEGNHVLIK
ncbi:HD domain-containing protein [soil metagenome]